jgi:N6-adenosine-specific RNA methylase IME4
MTKQTAVLPFLPALADRPLLPVDQIGWLNHWPLGGRVTATSWEMPDGMTRDEAIIVGQMLGKIGRSVGWWIGDWYVQSEARFGGMKELCEEAGLNYGSCRTWAIPCRRFTVSRRIDTVPFAHHQIVAPLPQENQDALLAWCAEDPEEPRSAQELKTRIQQQRRAEREEDLADRIEQESVAIGHQTYGLLYADPPWRLEPYSRETGLTRSADNHYCTMSLEALLDLEVMRVAPADDCVLFLWRTAPMLEDAMAFMGHYGFKYRSECIWKKDRVGTGYWFRNQHEVLMVGARGVIPAPAPGTQFPSIIEAPVGKHSEKPAVFAEMIETMFPTVAKLEMFARAPRAGWDSWGAEADGRGS